MNRSCKVCTKNGSSILKKLKPLTALYQQDSAKKKEPARLSRLKEMVRRRAKQKTRDDSLNARNGDRSPQGAAAWKGTSRGNPNRQWKRNERRPNTLR